MSLQSALFIDPFLVLFFITLSLPLCNLVEKQMTTLGETVQKVGAALTENLPTSAVPMSTSNGATGRSGPVSKKLEDMENDVIDVKNSQHMTTDFGHKVSNTDNWLRVASQDQTGATLLEDQVAREKVSVL